MAGPATILREIHRLWRNAKDLRTEIERIPRLLKAQAARVARQEESLHEAQDTLKRLKVTNHDRESQLKSTLQLVAKHEKQLNEAASKKEYDALKGEIAAEKQKYTDLENQILDTMAEIEERTAQLPEIEQALKLARTEYAEFEKGIQDRRSNLEQQLAKVVEQIRETESQLPGDVRPAYNRLVGARAEDAMAAVQGRTCMACYTEITAQNYNDLMLSQFVFCKSCGRALYLPE